jgi:RNA polymerase primary sigma factor
MIELDASAISRILGAFPDCLDPREKQVIEMRFGLADNPKKTLQQIGGILGVSRERVRQLEKRAIRKLSHPSRQGYVGKF